MSTSTLIVDLILASVFMVVADVVATVLVESEATYRRHLSAAMDTIGWMVSITTTEYSLLLLNSHSLTARLLCYLCVGVANYYGTWLGVGIGAKLMRRKPEREGPLSGALLRKTRDKGLKP